MNDYFETVEHELLHALRHRAHRPWYRRLRVHRSRTLAAIIACVFVGGPALAAAFGVLDGQPSAPSSGTFTSPKADSGVAALGYTVSVTPNLQAGAVGWCVSDLTFARHGGGGSSGCARTPSPSAPVVIAGGSDYTRARPGLSATTTSTVYLTTAKVAAVRVSRSLTILARTDGQLPSEYRIAILVHQTITHGRPGQPITVHLTAVALNRAGQRIGSQASEAPSAVPHDPSIFWTRGHPTSSTSKPPPRTPPSAACEIDTSALHGADVFFGSVVEHIHGFAELDQDSYLSCADTHFVYRGTPVVAAILLDAHHPGAPPAPLPDTTAVAGHSQTVAQPVKPASSSTHAPRRATDTITARRLGNAWLVVQARGSVSQRVAILDRLSACVRITGARCPTP